MTRSLAILAVLVLAASWPSVHAIPATELPQAPLRQPDLGRWTSTPRHAPTVAAVHMTPQPTAKVRTAAAVSGIASWGYGWSGVVTRLRRGTPISVCGALGCWSGRSEGYGPAKWTHRIADLSRAVFAAICGAPSKGLCSVTVAVR